MLFYTAFLKHPHMPQCTVAQTIFLNVQITGYPHDKQLICQHLIILYSHGASNAMFTNFTRQTTCFGNCQPWSHCNQT